VRNLACRREIRAGRRGIAMLLLRLGFNT